VEQRTFFIGTSKRLPSARRVANIRHCYTQVIWSSATSLSGQHQFLRFSIMRWEFIQSAALTLSAALIDQGDASSTNSRCILDYSQIKPRIIKSLQPEYGKDLSIIATGGSSTIRLFRRSVDDRLSAVKEFSSIPPNSPREECVKLEYLMGKTVSNGHPGIVETEELIHDPSTGKYWITSPYYNRSLAAEVHDLEAEDIERIFPELIDAVAHMHLRGIAYGDIKLENVLFDDNGRAKILDYGSATYSGCMESDDPSINAQPGDGHTPPYAPPESFECRRTYDRQKADSWALGILLYVMSAREMPWIKANNDSLAWCRWAGVSEGLHTSCSAMDGLRQQAQSTNATCSSLAVPGANKVPASLQHLLWGFLEPNASRRLMPVDVAAA